MFEWRWSKENVDNYIDIFNCKRFEVKCNIEVKYDYPPLKQIDGNNLLNRVLDTYKKVGVQQNQLKSVWRKYLFKNGFHSVI